MKRSKEPKLIRYLRTLNNAEMRRLRTAVESPFFNTDERVTQLFKTLYKLFPNFPDAPDLRARVYPEVFPRTKYNDLKLRRLFSKLTKVTEVFFAHLAMEEDQRAHHQLLSAYFREHNQPDFFFQNLDAQLKIHEQEVQHATQLEAVRMQLLDQRYSHPAFDRHNAEDRTPERILEAAERFFIYAKLRYGLVLMSKGKIFNTQYTPFLADPSEADTAPDFLADNPTYQIYRQSLNLTHSPSNVNLEAYQRGLFEQFDRLLPGDRYFLFVVGINTLIRRANLGADDRRRVALEWYQMALERGLYEMENSLSPVTFNNIVAIGVQQKQFDWTHNFVERYSPQLPKNVRRDELNFARAVISFYRGEVDKTVQTLNKHIFSEAYSLKTRHLLLLSHFHFFLEDHTYLRTFLSQASSYMLYIKRNTTYTTIIRNTFLKTGQVTQQLARKLHQGMSRAEVLDWFETNAKPEQPLAGRAYLESVLRSE